MMPRFPAAAKPRTPMSNAPPDSSSPRPRAWVVAALIGLLSLIWGSTWIVIAVGLKSLPPYTSAGIRFVVAATVMTLIAPVLTKREGGQKPATWLWVVLGITGFGASYAIVYWSETRLPTALVAILWSVFPMMMAFASHFFLGHRLTGARPWLGFVLGLAGVVLLFATALPALGPGAVPAALVLLGSPFVSCIGTTLVKKHGQGTSSVLLNRNGMALGAVMLCALAWALERDAPTAWDTNAIGSIAYLSLVGTVIAFGLYYWLLRTVPAHVLSLITYLTPAFAVLLGAWVGGEPITWFTVGGCATILFGVFLVMKPGKSSARATRESTSAARGTN
jgi:drug/metabolite transporter (DMT)-like permease